MPTFDAGPAQGVSVVTSGAQAASPAVPVYVVSGGPTVPGPARRVIVVSGGPVEARAAIPVYEVTAVGPLSSEPALPVYVVSGSLGLNPALAYTNKVKALSPLAYWPQAEASGATAIDESGGNHDGAYTSVTLGQIGIGDGRTAALYTPGASRLDISAARTFFNGNEGTVALWAKVSGAGVWTDSTSRYLWRMVVTSGANEFYIRRTTVNNQLQFLRIGNSVSKTISDISLAGTTNWFHLAMTWSTSADQLIAYINGLQVGTTQTGNGTFTGTPTAAGSSIGTFSSGLTAGFDGTIAHAALWTTPLTAVQIATLATVS